MLFFWQNIPLYISPVIFTIGNLSIRWYSLAYILAILTIFFLAKKELLKKNNANFLTQGHLENILFFSFLGALLGGKIGYIIFYAWHNFLSNPMATISPFTNHTFVGFYGMSFHGGLLGVLLFSWSYCKKYKLSFRKIVNFLVPFFPLGYLWGRVGNFMNGELYGRITENQIGMHFKDYPDQLRHPSQFYEALGEGLLLFLILKYFSQYRFKNKLLKNLNLSDNILALFLVFYGLIRFAIEFFRLPDPQLGFILFSWLTMGQILCILMIIVGIIILWIRNKTIPIKI